MQYDRNRTASFGGRWLVALVAAFTGMVSTAPQSLAAVRQEIPEEQAGPPYYARIDSEALHTEEWAVVPFYRDPECVPDSFNLLNLFDVPGAFSCPLTVEGFVIWENGPPPQDQAPIHQELRESGPVPMWFVSWPELEAAMADGVLTIVELEALPSLQVGYGDFFHETLHPVQGAQRGHIQMTARGTLEDGRTFQVHVTSTEGSEEQGTQHLAIRVR